MNDSKANKTMKKIDKKEQTKKIFLERIKALDSKEQESLLKLYDKIIEDMK